MGAAQDQSVHPLFQKRVQIAFCHLHCNFILEPSLLHQRDQQRTGLAYYLDLWIIFMYDGRIQLRLYSTSCTYEADFFIPGGLCSHLCSRLHHTDDRDIYLLPYGFQRHGTGCITRHHNGLHVLGLQETYDLTGIFQHDIF